MNTDPTLIPGTQTISGVPDPLREYNSCHTCWYLYTPSIETRNVNGNTMNLIEKAFDLILLLTGSVAIVAFTL